MSRCKLSLSSEQAGGLSLGRHFQLDSFRNVSGLFIGFGDGRAGLGAGTAWHSGTFVRNLSHPCAEQHVHPLVNQLADFASARRKEILTALRATHVCAKKLGEDFARHHPMTFAPLMNAVTSEFEGLIL